MEAIKVFWLALVAFLFGEEMRSDGRVTYIRHKGGWLPVPAGGATGTQEFVDTTTADVFLPEIWSQESIVARESRTVLSKHVNRKLEQNLKYGDTIHVPSVTNLAARTKSANTAITYETQTETNTNVTISTHQYAAMAVEDIIKVQANRDLMATYSGKLGYALDLAVDDVLAGLIDDLTNSVGTLAADLTYEQMIRARQYLDDADVPDDDRWVYVSPAQEAGMLKLEHFINRDYTEANGVSKGGGDKGWIGSWMSMPVYKSTNCEGTNAAGHDNGMVHIDAFALVLQMKPKMRTQYDIDYDVDKVAAFQLYGTATLRADHGVFMRGS